MTFTVALLLEDEACLDAPLRIRNEADGRSVKVGNRPNQAQAQSAAVNSNGIAATMEAME